VSLIQRAFPRNVEWRIAAPHRQAHARAEPPLGPARVTGGDPNELPEGGPIGVEAYVRTDSFRLSGCESG
jgi:hypothetical protein